MLFRSHHRRDLAAGIVGGVGLARRIGDRPGHTAWIAPLCGLEMPADAIAGGAIVGRARASTSTLASMVNRMEYSGSVK